MVPWNSARTKVQLKLAVQRLRTIQEKKESLAKKARRDIATLVERGKMETAKIRVENIINDDIHVELLELLELYCELLIARFGLLENSVKEPDPGVAEAVCAIIHAAPRSELKELQVLREMLMHKFGREFSLAVIENKDSIVSDRIVKKIVTEQPPATLIDAYLVEITKAYGVPYVSSFPPQDDEDKGGDGGLAETPLERLPKITEPAQLAEPTTEQIAAKLPDMPPTESASETPKTVPPKAATTNSTDDFEALKRRLDALKFNKKL